MKANLAPEVRHSGEDATEADGDQKMFVQSVSFGSRTEAFAVLSV